MAGHPSPECTCKSKEIGQTDRQTDTVVYMGSRGCLCPLWSWPPPPGCWPSGSGGTGHAAVPGARDQAWGEATARVGDGPENTGRGLVHPALAEPRGRRLQLPSSTQPLGVPRAFPGQAIGEWISGTLPPKGSTTGLALSESGGHTGVMVTQRGGPTVCHLPCQDRVEERISLFFKNKNKTKNG